MANLAIPRNRIFPRLVVQHTLVAAYVAALGLSAALLFGIQPMFAKMVLPRLGGSASVWSIAMVFFQTMLLAGYLYAHLSMRHLSFRGSIALHLFVLAITVFALPIGIAHGFARPPGPEPGAVGNRRRQHCTAPRRKTRKTASMCHTHVRQTGVSLTHLGG